MSLNNIQLPGLLFQSIFKNMLVDLKSFQTNSDSESKMKFHYLGGNEKNIAFVINNKQDKYLNDRQLKFLSELNSACNLTLADIAVININNIKVANYNDLSGELKCCKLLCFGVSAADLGLPFNIPLFQTQLFQEIQYMFCPALEQLQDDPAAKKQLWTSLRNIFKIQGEK
ncbi:MAG: hypothetical protein ABIO81_07685 [Ginsengibacter sp.]